MRVKALVLLIVVATVLQGQAVARPMVQRLPIIDMHVHAMVTPRPVEIPTCTGDQAIVYLPIDPVMSPPDASTVRCADPIYSTTRKAEFQRQTIAALRKVNVVRAVLIGQPEELAGWRKAALHLFISASVPRGRSAADLDELRASVIAGKVSIFGEFDAQNLGLRADDPMFEPFWALAESLDVPVGIHLGEGVQQVGQELVAMRYKAALTSPFQLEQVIKRHPKIRIYAMHAGSPLTDEMIAMLFTYPSLYVDISANDWNMPRAQFYGQLRRLVDAGFSKRIMFGSDQTIFPQAIEIAVRTIEQAPFLTPEQKRDILYNNAARFLRLTPAEIASDYGARKVQQKRAAPKPRP